MVGPVWDETWSLPIGLFTHFGEFYPGSAFRGSSPKSLNQFKLFVTLGVDLCPHIVMSLPPAFRHVDVFVTVTPAPPPCSVIQCKEKYFAAFFTSTNEGGFNE